MDAICLIARYERHKWLTRCSIHKVLSKREREREREREYVCMRERERERERERVCRDV